MESPIALVKSAVNPGNILKGAIAFIVLAALFDLAGITNWLLFPVTTARAKFSKAVPAA